VFSLPAFHFNLREADERLGVPAVNGPDVRRRRLRNGRPVSQELLDVPPERERRQEDRVGQTITGYGHAGEVREPRLHPLARVDVNDCVRLLQRAPFLRFSPPKRPNA